MGTSMTFYNIVNKDFTREELLVKLSDFPVRPMFTPEVMEMMKNTKMPQEVVERFRTMASLLPAMSNPLNDDGSVVLPSASTPIIAYSESAKLLPFFSIDLCEGYNASSTDTDRLSERFGAPVLAFSIFDSDVLFVSYSDKAAGITYNYAKPNFDDFDAYETELYAQEFPEFLLGFCDKVDHQKLRDIWAKNDYVFADDRMHDMCEVIGAKVLYNTEEIPEGYEAIARPKE